MTTDRVTKAIEALDGIIMGMTHPENKCWPTVRSWTKQERDEQVLLFARNAKFLLSQLSRKEG